MEPVSKGEKTRQRIIEASIELFQKHGYHWVSFQKIAARAGVSQPALYMYFEDKDDLLQACCNQVAENGRAYIDGKIRKQDSTKERLKVYMRANLQWTNEYPSNAGILLAMYHLAPISAKIHHTYVRFNDTSISRLEEQLHQGNREGDWKCRDVSACARVIHNLLLAEIFKTFNDPKELTLKRRFEILWKASLAAVGA